MPRREKERQRGVTASANHNLMIEHAAVILKPHLQASPPPPGISCVSATRKPFGQHITISFSSYNFTFSVQPSYSHICTIRGKAQLVNLTFKEGHTDFRSASEGKREAKGRDSKCQSYIYIYMYKLISTIV